MMFYIILILLFIVLTLLKLIEIYKKYKKSKIPVHEFNVVIANNKKKREKGLMYRKNKLKKNEGMLFDYKKPKKITLWMKNTYIPLDAIFLNSDGLVLDYKKNMKPKSLKSYSSKFECKYALELNANTINDKNIKINDYVKLNIINKLK